MTEPQLNKTRHRLGDTFTTAEIRQEAHRNGIQDERAAIDWLITHSHIERVKVGHYQKCERYRGEQ